MKTDIFISYRRNGGEDLALLIYRTLRSEGYSVFLDVEGLGSGKFNEKLYEKIRECKDFLLILPPNALDRCVNEEDWVRLEIECALRENKWIIPVWMPNFDGWPANLPASLHPIRNLNALYYHRGYFSEMMEKLKAPGNLQSSPNQESSKMESEVPIETCEEAEGLIYIKDYFRCPDCGSRKLRRTDRKDRPLLLLDSLHEVFRKLQFLILSVVVVCAVVLLSLSEEGRVPIEEFLLTHTVIHQDYFNTDSTFLQWFVLLLGLWFLPSIPILAVDSLSQSIHDSLYKKELLEGPHTVRCCCKNCKTVFLATSSEKQKKDWMPDIEE